MSCADAGPARSEVMRSLPLALGAPRGPSTLARNAIPFQDSVLLGAIAAAALVTARGIDQAADAGRAARAGPTRVGTTVAAARATAAHATLDARVAAATGLHQKPHTAHAKYTHM